MRGTNAYFNNFKQWGVGWTQLRTLKFKKGWTAWGWRPFFLLYATTYLASVVLGFGIAPLSRVLWEYGSMLISPTGKRYSAGPSYDPVLGKNERWEYPRTRKLMLLVDRFFVLVFRQKPGHCRDCGHRIFKSVNVWRE